MLKVWQSEEGKKQFDKILKLLKSSASRIEFKKKFLEFGGKPPFEKLEWGALKDRLTREARDKKSKIGKLWKNLPKGSRATLGVNWSDDMKESFKKDWSGNVPIAEIREKYKDPKTGEIYKNYQFSAIGKMLGVSRKLKGQASVKGCNVDLQNPEESISTLDQKLLELINAGKFVELGVDGLLNLINQTFSEQLQLTKSALEEKLDKVLWDKKTLNELAKILQNSLPLKKFLEYHPTFPPDIVQAKANWYVGASYSGKAVSFLPGIGRIADEKTLKSLNDYEFPATSFEKPYIVKVPDNRKWTATVLNGPLIGLKHKRSIRDNVPRKILADAQRRQDVAVVIVNVIDIDTKKAAGPTKVHRALVSGRNVNVRVLDPSYQEKAKRIVDDQPADEVIFETYAEVFENILHGWGKISSMAEYNGQVLLIFGRNEEELMTAAAYWELRYWTLRTQVLLDVEIQMAKNNLARARDDEDNDEVKAWGDRLDQLQKEKSRTTVTNISVEHLQRTYNRVRAYVVKRLEETITNCKVIGQGSTYVQIGNEKIEFHIPKISTITDSVLARYADSYGPQVLRGKFADTVVICHPYALNYRMTCRESDQGGQRKSSQIHVAPVSIDGAFLREQLQAVLRGVHPVSRLVFDNQFSPGSLRLNCSNEIVAGDFSPVNSIGAYKKFIGNEIAGEKKTLIDYPDCQYVWIFNASDPHWGSRSKAYVWDSKHQKYLGMCEAVIEMMRRANLFQNAGLPVHMYNICDDPTQGNLKYGTHKQPDLNQMSYMMMEDLWRGAIIEARAKDASSKDRLNILERMQKLNLSQIQSNGLDWLQDQVVEMTERHIEANIDFYDAILSRALKAGIKVTGASIHRKENFNSADIGLLNFGSGNHFGGTVDKVMTEGFIYADKARTLLRSLPRWRKKSDILKELVRSPRHGNVAIGWGLIKSGNGYQWGIELRDSPARLSSWGDTLLGAVRNDIKRANYSMIFDKKVTLKIYGDKHFFGGVATDYAIYHMCASGTHTDSYGDMGGFPPNNTGVSFVGLPVNGPASGPILMRTLRYDQIKRYFDNPYQFDWEAFLPNPV